MKALHHSTGMKTRFLQTLAIAMLVLFGCSTFIGNAAARDLGSLPKVESAAWDLRGEPEPPAVRIQRLTATRRALRMSQPDNPVAIAPVRTAIAVEPVTFASPEITESRVCLLQKIPLFLLNRNLRP